MERYIATQFYKADSPESRILGESGLVPSEFVLAADAQRALDAEREKVKELVANQAEYEKCTDEQITALNQGCLDYEKQIATLQAQLAALRHDYAQLKEAYDAKESGVPLGPVVGAQTIVNQQREINRLQAQLRHMTKERDIQKEVADNQAWHVRDLKAQLRQVEGERDAHAQDVDDLIDCCINDVLVTHTTPGGKPHDPDPQIRPLRDKIAGSLVELQTLRQLVEALPVVDGRMDVECGACYYIRSFIAGQYGVVCGLITEQSTAMAIKTLLEYRAVLAAKDAPHPTEEQS